VLKLESAVKFLPIAVMHRFQGVLLFADRQYGTVCRYAALYGTVTEYREIELKTHIFSDYISGAAVALCNFGAVIQVSKDAYSLT